jgi:hypothetical protein
LVRRILNILYTGFRQVGRKSSEAKIIESTASEQSTRMLASVWSKQSERMAEMVCLRATRFSRGAEELKKGVL